MLASYGFVPADQTETDAGPTKPPAPDETDGTDEAGGGAERGEGVGVGVGEGEGEGEGDVERGQSFVTLRGVLGEADFEKKAADGAWPANLAREM